MSSTTRGFPIVGLDGGRVVLTSGQLDDLAARVAGRLLCAGEEGWNGAVGVWNGAVTGRPALVVQPVSARDVAAVVDFAREHRVLLGVKGGGHNIGGTAIADGGLDLDMSRMREIVVDSAARRARVQPGCLLGEVDRATQRHGLATVLGFISEVGVAGLTLGGGLGYLTRRFGWTVDNLEEVEIVTADGRIRTSSRERDADLFWAVRGGGGNFGVVTRFTFRLHPVGPAVYGGLVAWPFERAGEVLAAYRAITGEGPRELAAWLILLHAPPAPFVPEAWHGRKICAMAVCFSGEPAEAERALGPIRALGEPVFDLLRQQPYTELQSYLDPTEPRGLAHYWKTEYAAELSDALLATLRELFAGSDLPEGEIGVLHVGGALNDHPEDDGAVGNRDARFAIGVKAMWDAASPDAETIRRWVRHGWERIRPFSTGRSYVNFQTDDEGEDRIRATYGANFDRLAAIKRRYDPDNLFRVNRNIAPERGAAAGAAGRPATPSAAGA